MNKGLYLGPRCVPVLMIPGIGVAILDLPYTPCIWSKFHIKPSVAFRFQEVECDNTLY